MKILKSDYKNYGWLRRTGLNETAYIFAISQRIKFQDDLNLVIDALKGVVEKYGEKSNIS